MLTFALAVFLLIATPGPGVLSTAGVGAAFGVRPGLRYLTGLFIGTNLVLAAVITGVAALVLGQPALRVVLMTASAAYLLYLASRIALAGARVAFIDAAAPPGIAAGIVLQLINPKAYAVNSALISGFAFWPQSLAVETLLKLVIMNAIWLPLHLVWLWAGVTLKRLDLAPHVQRRINHAMAAALVLVVALAVGSTVMAGRGP